MFDFLFYILCVYTMLLLIRYVLTAQELTFNYIAKGVDRFTGKPLKLGNMPKSRANKFTLLLIFLLATGLGLLGSFLGGEPLIDVYRKFLSFIALFFIVCILFGSGMTAQSGSFPMFFYRLGDIWVRPAKVITRIRSNLVVIPAIMLVLIAYYLPATVLNMVFISISVASALKLATAMILAMLISAVGALSFLLFIRIILSWFSPDPRNIFYQLLYFVTEPVIKPFRVIPPIGMFDISALVAIIALRLLSSGLGHLFLWLSL